MVHEFRWLNGHFDTILDLKGVPEGYKLVSTHFEDFDVDNEVVKSSTTIRFIKVDGQRASAEKSETLDGSDSESGSLPEAESLPRSQCGNHAQTTKHADEPTTSDLQGLQESRQLIRDSLKRKRDSRSEEEKATLDACKRQTTPQ